jgi:hypothetical protein
MISTRPRTEGGKNSSTAVNIAVNYPPTLIPVKNLPTINKVNIYPSKQHITPTA